MTHRRGGDCPRPFWFLNAAGRHNCKPVLALSLGLLLLFVNASAQKRPRAKRIATTAPSAGLTVTTEPNAIIWIDEVRRGQTDATGKLVLNNLSAKPHTMRVRALGFKESTAPLPGGRRAVTVKLLRSTDQAELLFQQAEDAREKAKGDEAKQKAAELYRQALALRSVFPAAHLGLARAVTRSK